MNCFKNQSAIPSKSSEKCLRFHPSEIKSILITKKKKKSFKLCKSTTKQLLL